MEKTEINKDYKIQEFQDVFYHREGVENDLLIHDDTGSSTILDQSDKYAFESIEDSSALIGNFFKGKSVILQEDWTFSESIQAKVVSFNEEEVYIDCLIDLQGMIFEHRSFPKILFDHLDLSPNKPVIIKTKTKKGTIQIDVYSGEGIVNLDLFELNDDWGELKDSGLDNLLTEW